MTGSAIGSNYALPSPLEINHHIFFSSHRNSSIAKKSSFYPHAMEVWRSKKKKKSFSHLARSLKSLFSYLIKKIPLAPAPTSPGFRFFLSSLEILAALTRNSTLVYSKTRRQRKGEEKKVQERVTSFGFFCSSSKL